MRLLAVALFMTALVQISSADFILFWVQQLTYSLDSALILEGFKILGPNDDPGGASGCEKSDAVIFNETSSDVNGNKHGFRCKGSKKGAGCGLGANPYDLEQLEWNLHAEDHFHWSNWVHSHEEAASKWYCISKYDWVSLSLGYQHPNQTTLDGTTGNTSYIAGNSTSELAHLKANKGTVQDEAKGRKLNETELAEFLKDWSKGEADTVWTVYRGEA